MRPWQHVLEPLFGYLLLGVALDRGNFSGEQFNFGPIDNQLHTVEQLVIDLSSDCNFTNDKAIYQSVKLPAFKENQILRLNSNKAWALLKWRSLLSYNETIKFTNEWYWAYYKQSVDVKQITLRQIDYFSQIIASQDNFGVSHLPPCPIFLKGVKDSPCGVVPQKPNFSVARSIWRRYY